jgi:hypothetical protein
MTPSGFLKKALSNEEQSYPSCQNYLFPTALAIIFTLRGNNWYGHKLSKDFYRENISLPPEIRQLFFARHPNKMGRMPFFARCSQIKPRWRRSLWMSW